MKPLPALFEPGSPLPGGTPVTLPHTWYRDGEYYRGAAVYQKRFVPGSTVGRRTHVFLRFHGVDKTCAVYVNGHKAGSHEGGYSIFCLEITNDLLAGEENLITVTVNNENGTAVNPLSGDFTIFGGIHRKVEWIETGDSFFDPTFWGTEGVIFETFSETESKGYVLAEPHVRCHDPENHSVRYTLYDPKGQIAAEAAGRIGEAVKITVSHPKLWNGRQKPWLYTVSAALMRGDTEVDEVRRRIGFRTVRIDPDKGFFLNGKSLKLHGVAKHQDTAGVFSAVSDSNLDTDMALIEEIGANAVRLSHYQHPQHFMDLCDEKGMLVWAEIPMLKLTENVHLLENAQLQLKELILQNIHRPSIVMWGLQNEIAIFGEKPWMYDRMRLLQKEAKALDPYRLTTSANLNSVPLDSPLNRITDIVAYNLYYGWYYGETADMDDHLDEFHRLNPDIPLGISEYGVDCNPRFHSDTPRVKDYSEEFQARYHETIYPKFASRPFVWGSFIWNMFDFVSGIRDEGGVKYRNNKGLVTHDRKTRKDSFYYYKAIWADELFVHIAEKRFVNRVIGTMDIRVYSNYGEVTLLAGGKTYRKQSDTGVFLFPRVPVNAGENPVRAVAGSCEDRTVFIGTEAPDPEYIFIDPNPGVNVKNWFADEAEKEKLFPTGHYSILDPIGDLLESPEVMELIERIQPKVAAFMRDTIGTFTLEQGLSHAKSLCTEEEIKNLNAQITTVRR